MYEAIYIGNIQEKFKKRIYGYLSNLLCLLKNGQKQDSFAAHFKHHFNATASHTDLQN